MDLQFRLPDAPDESDLGQFFDWLRLDRSLRTRSEASLLPAAPVEGGMGVSLEAVQLVLDSGFQLASLAIAIASWRKACEPRSDMTLTRGDVEIRLSRADLEDVESVLAALERLRTAEDSPETGDEDEDGNGDGPR